MRAALVCLPLLALSAIACDTTAKLAGGAPKDSVAVLIKQYQDQTLAATQASAAKDSVITELGTATKLMDQLGDVEKEIGVKGASKGEPVEKWDARTTRRLEEIKAHFKALNGRLANLSKLVPENKKLQEQIASLTATIDEKQARIGELQGQLAAAQQENTRLTGVAAAKTDTIHTLVDDSNKVYWIAGLKDELLKQGVIREVGGSKVLLVTTVGKSLAPARTLQTSLFKLADRRTLKEIPLDGRYEIVTPQDLKFVQASSLEPKGRYVQGNLGITDPQFWANSRYLILVKK